MECASPSDSPGEQGLKLPPFLSSPSVSGCVWGWAGKVPISVQGLLAGFEVDTEDTSPMSVDLPLGPGGQDPGRM